MTHERVIAYLLEELPTDEAERLEEELFAVDEWPTEVHAVEDDLIEDYLRGELSPERKQRFEDHYLISEARCDRVRAAAAVLRRIEELCAAEKKAAPPGWFARLRAGWNFWSLAFRFAAVTGGLVVVIGTFWFVGLRTHAPQTFATLSLTIGNPTRGDGPPTQRINLLGKDALRVTLALPEAALPAAKYRLQVENDAGQAVSTEDPKRDGRSLVVDIPAGGLRRGGYYEIKLYLTDDAGLEQRVPGSYVFAVE